MFGYQHTFFFHILDRLKLKNPSKKLVSKNLLSIGRYNCTETSLISIHTQKPVQLISNRFLLSKIYFLKMCTFREMRYKVNIWNPSWRHRYHMVSYTSQVLNVVIFFRKYYYLIFRLYLRKRLKMQRALTRRFLL